MKSESGKLHTRVINTYGIPESIIGERVRRIIVSDEDLTCSILESEGIVSIHISVYNTEERGADAALNKAEDVICRELESSVFSKGGETLEEIVSKSLTEHTSTLAVAESCTGGLVSNLLTNVQGSSVFFSGGVISYSNKVKTGLLHVSGRLIEKYGAVSAEVAKAMASGVRKRIQADIGLAVTGIAGPSGIEEGLDHGKPVGLVYVATEIDGGLECKEYRFPGSRIEIKKHAANAALNDLRLCLSGKQTTC